MIFVRHGRAIATPDLPTHDWPLDPDDIGEITGLRALLPDLPVVCSDMRRAVDTACLLGEPTVEAGLSEVSRPWAHDLDEPLRRYFRGERVEGWEPQAEVRARVQAVTDKHREAVYVTHGTALSLYVASVVPNLDAFGFWTGLQSPDAWQIDGEQLVHLLGRRSPDGP